MSAEIERAADLQHVTLPVDERPSLTTPAGLQAIATLHRRRLIVLTLNLVTWGLVLLWAGSILSAGSWTYVDAVMFVCVACGAPWTVLGFWNALIGLWQLRANAGNLSAVAPGLAAGGAQPIRIKTAVLMTLRNEDPARALLRLKVMKASIDATGDGARFSYFVLSDTDLADIAAIEDTAISAWKAEDRDAANIIYRRRTNNAGFKAGNVRDFCERWGQDYDVMLPLDADSLMTGSAVVDLVRAMQRHPKLGILQSLVVGAPSSSAFARIFQFGMRLGMRTYTMGQAWWVGDCGPYWGHNALVRIKPFAENCRLPILPGKPPFGGHIMSHDQVEAVLMRRAGFEVRVMPIEIGSYEDNPPDALEFMRRDARWCQGNMQYAKLLGLPGIEPVSRFQLFWAMLMFVGVPAWTVLIALLPFAAADAQSLAGFPTASAKLLYVTLLAMYLTPKLAGVVDAVATHGEVVRFGGPMRFTLSVVIELMFSLLLGALTTLRTSISMFGLLGGRSVRWDSQRRDGEAVSWHRAARALWPQLVFGAVICVALAMVSPQTLFWSLPLTAGYLLAIPFTVLTASPKLGKYLRKHGLAAIPEDLSAPPELRAVQPARA